ncbi:MAG: gluconate 2-dehydrogenase subunit 3 family protein [Pseudonocardiaceae bacterium]
MSVEGKTMPQAATGQAAEQQVSWPYVMPHSGFLSAVEQRQLDAVFAQIVPRDPARRIPGATDAGAARFVSLLLAMDAAVYDEIPAWRLLYRAALAALDAHSRQIHGTSLEQLADPEMIMLLKRLEQGQLTPLELPAGTTQPTVFKTFWRHCLQGCFADPRWGGNQDRIMWRWLGYLQQPEEVL